MSATGSDVVDATLEAANVMLDVASRSMSECKGPVTSSQLRVLMFLAQGEPQHLSAVANELGVHPSNATRACEKLVRSGLVTRSNDPGDRRYVRLEPTGAGRALVDGVLDSRRRALTEVLRPLSAAQQRRIGEAFAAFVTAAGSVMASGGGRAAVPNAI